MRIIIFWDYVFPFQKPKFRDVLLTVDAYRTSMEGCEDIAVVTVSSSNLRALIRYYCLDSL